MGRPGDIRVGIHALLRHAAEVYGNEEDNHEVRFKIALAYFMALHVDTEPQLVD